MTETPEVEILPPRGVSARPGDDLETLLSDEKWAKWSDAEISRRCRVGDHLVAEVRSSLRENEVRPGTERTYTTKHGTTATMGTARIGARELRVNAA